MFYLNKNMAQITKLEGYFMCLISTVDNYRIEILNH